MQTRKLLKKRVKLVKGKEAILKLLCLTENNKKYCRAKAHMFTYILTLTYLYIYKCMYVCNSVSVCAVAFEWNAEYSKWLRVENECSEIRKFPFGESYCCGQPAARRGGEFISGSKGKRKHTKPTTEICWQHSAVQSCWLPVVYSSFFILFFYFENLSVCMCELMSLQTTIDWDSCRRRAVSQSVSLTDRQLFSATAAPE